MQFLQLLSLVCAALQVYAEECIGDCPAASNSLIQAKTARQVLPNIRTPATSPALIQRRARSETRVRLIKAAQARQRTMAKGRAFKKAMRNKQGSKSAEVQELCVMQDELCFDMELDTSWDVKPPPYLRVDGLNKIQEEFLSAVGSFAETEEDVSFDSSTVQLVVTRAGEDLRWLDALPQLPAIVYNRKGPDRTLPQSRPNLQIVAQVNSGREDEAMLRHIVDNYDQLSDVTVFLQGWPFGHCPGLLRSVRRSVSALLDDKKFAAMENSAGLRPGLIPLSGTFWQYDLEAGRLGLAISIAKGHHLEIDGATQWAKEQFASTCAASLGKECPSSLWLAEGAQWAVSKDRIRSTPKSVYEGGLLMGEGWEDKFRGLVYEAIWPYIWGEESWMPDQVEYVKEIGEAANRSRSSDGHCAADWGRRTLLFSCSDKAEFCERQRMTGDILSEAWAEERTHFQVGQGDKLNLTGNIKTIFYGASTWMPFPEPDEIASESSTTRFLSNIVEDAGQLRAGKYEQNEEAVTWRVEYSHGGQENDRHISRTNSLGERAYLGCSDGLATLLEDPVVWVANSRPDGYVTLTTRVDQARSSPKAQLSPGSTEGHIVRLSLNPNDREGRFHCRDEYGQVVPNSKDSTFEIVVDELDDEM